MVNLKRIKCEIRFYREGLYVKSEYGINDGIIFTFYYVIKHIVISVMELLIFQRTVSQLVGTRVDIVFS